MFRSPPLRKKTEFIKKTQCIDILTWDRQRRIEKEYFIPPCSRTSRDPAELIWQKNINLRKKYWKYQTPAKYQKYFYLNRISYDKDWLSFVKNNMASFLIAIKEQVIQSTLHNYRDSVSEQLHWIYEYLQEQ